MSHSGGRDPLGVGLIGYGAIGTVVAGELDQGGVPGCTLAGVLTAGHSEAPKQARSADELADRSDLVVEVAGQQAVRELGPAVVGTGTDLLIVSVGALADDALRTELTRPGAGRLLISTGAIGGLDTLRAAMLLSPLTDVSLTTTKTPQSIDEPWMDRDLRRRLAESDQPVTAFSGAAREAVRLFPRSVNVAATIALATVGLDRLRVTVVGEPGRRVVNHAVQAEGAAGRYTFSFENVPSEDNPRTSAITPYAVLRALHNLGAHVVVGV